MKRKILPFLPLLLIAATAPILSSCNTQKTVKAHLDYGLITKDKINEIGELAELDYSGLSSLIKNEKSFLLVLYNETCGCWKDFAPVLVDFINDYHISFEYINVNQFIDKDLFNLYIEKGDMPAVAVFSKGKLMLEATYSDSRNMFKSHKELYKFVSENTVLPKQFYIDQATLDSFIQEEKEFNLYIARKECPDCQAADKDILNKWNYSVDAVNEPLYIFDLQPYYPGKDATDEVKENYQNIKDMYGLSEKNNPVLGYSTGMVPTFQRRKGSQVLDMVVILNDSQNEGVISSYFTSERVQNMPFLQGSGLKVDLDGMTFEKSDIELDWKQNWRSYKSEYYQKYHYPILEKFISTYVN